MGVSEALASGYTIHVKAAGRSDWTLSPLTQGDKGRLEQWARQRAYAAVCTAAGILPVDDYRALLADLRNEIGRGDWSVDGKLFKEALASFDGNVETVRVMLSKAHPDVTTDAALAVMGADPDAVLFAMTVLMPDIELTEEGHASVKRFRERTAARS